MLGKRNDRDQTGFNFPSFYYDWLEGQLSHVRKLSPGIPAPLVKTTVAIRNDSSTENINRDKQVQRSTLPLVMELQRYVEKVSKISLYENEDSQQRMKESRNDKR